MLVFDLDTSLRLVVTRRRIVDGVFGNKYYLTFNILCPIQVTTWNPNSYAVVGRDLVAFNPRPLVCQPCRLGTPVPKTSELAPAHRRVGC